MRLTPETQRKVVLEALMSAGGDREEAAKTLGVSVRSLNRYIKELDLYPVIDKMGWMKHKGPPRGGGSVVRMRILSHIRKHHGSVDYGALAIEIYGADGRVERQRIYSALEQMRASDQIKIEGDRWTIVADPRLVRHA